MFCYVCVLSPQIQRIAPLESSMVALETLTGNDESLTVEEIFNSMLQLTEVASSAKCLLRLWVILVSHFSLPVQLLQTIQY